MRAYLAAAKRALPLTPAEEDELLAAVHAGERARSQLAADEGGAPQLEPDERRRLEGELEAGEDAKRRILAADQRFVIAKARLFLGRGLSASELILAGNVGLLRASEKFDRSKGCAFFDYASWWIREGMSRALAEEARAAGAPQELAEDARRLVESRRSLTLGLLREPTDEELAGELGVGAERLAELQRILGEPADEPDFSDASGRYAFLEPDEDEMGEEERARLYDAVRRAIQELPERERAILTMRHGLEDGQARTLEEVCRAFNLSRARVRQLEAKALAIARRRASDEWFHQICSD